MHFHALSRMVEVVVAHTQKAVKNRFHNRYTCICNPINKDVDFWYHELLICINTLFSLNTSTQLNPNLF